MISNSVPNDWDIKTIADLHAEDVPKLNPFHFQDEKFENFSIPAYQDSETPYLENGSEILSQKLAIPSRCILFGKLNPRVEKVWNVKTGNSFRHIASTEWLPIVPKDGVDQDFIYYLMWSDWVMPVAQRLVTGSTPSRQRVEPKGFYEIVVPMPELREQQAIAALLRIVQEVSRLQLKHVQSLQALKRTAMQTLFTRGLRGEGQKETEIGPAPESWDVVQLRSLGRIGNGSTPRKATSGYWAGGLYPWLTSAKVYDRNIVDAEQFVTELALTECHLPRIKPGAVLIAITGQGKTLGHCAVLGIEATINQHLAYIEVDANRVHPSFVRGYLETQYDFFRQVGLGGGSTKGALTCAFLRRFPIPIPSVLEEQREIVSILEAIDRKIDLHGRKRAVLEELFKALLHKLMTGEIRVGALDLTGLSIGAASERAMAEPIGART